MKNLEIVGEGNCPMARVDVEMGVTGEEGSVLVECSWHLLCVHWSSGLSVK